VMKKRILITGILVAALWHRHSCLCGFNQLGEQNHTRRNVPQNCSQIPSGDCQGAVGANWNGYSLTTLSIGFKSAERLIEQTVSEGDRGKVRSMVP